MPRLSAWYIRASFLHLTLAVTYGALILTAKAVPGWGWSWMLFPSHIEEMAYGWMLQFVLGIAFWALPRYKHGPKRGDERPIWAAWGLLNLGIVLLTFDPWIGIGWIRSAGSMAEVLAVVIFTISAWPRIKPLGT